MRLIYLDESGISSNESVVVVAGVIIDADNQWVPVAEYIRSIIAEYIPVERQFNFTFHAKDLFHGTGRTFFDRRRFPIERSHEALKLLLGVPARFNLPVIYGYVDKRVATSADSKLNLKPREDIAMNHAIAFSMCAAAAEAFMKDRAKPNEVATLHAENNTDTHKMLRLARRSLGGRSKYNLRQFMGSAAQRYLPITRIVDEISFHEKGDAFLLQIADACALFLRYALESKEKCEAFFDALTNNQRHILTQVAKQLARGSVGMNMLLFEDLVP